MLLIATAAAERGLERVDEIVSESINAETKDYAEKGKVSSYVLHLGKASCTVAFESVIML